MWANKVAVFGCLLYLVAASQPPQEKASPQPPEETDRSFRSEFLRIANMSLAELDRLTEEAKAGFDKMTSGTISQIDRVANGTMKIFDMDNVRKQLASEVKPYFDGTNLRNSPVMQTILSRLMQSGSYMTQPIKENKSNIKRNNEPKVEAVPTNPPPPPQLSHAVTILRQEEPKSENVKATDKTQVIEDPSKFFKMGDMSIAGAVGLGALALGALIATPIVAGAGALSRSSDDDPNGVSKKSSWLDSLAFWKEDSDKEPFYEVPVVVSNEHEKYNPYYDLGDGTGFDPSSMFRYDEENEDYYSDYTDGGTRLDKQTKKKTYYSDYADQGAKLDKTKKKKTYYSDADFWKDHYYKDGVIYEKNSKTPSSSSVTDSYYGATSYGKDGYPPKRANKKPQSRVSTYLASGYDSDNYYADSGYSASGYGTKDGKNKMKDEKDDVFVTVDEINKIANESLNDILSQYRQFLRKVDDTNVAYADDGTYYDQDLAYESSDNKKAQVYSGRVGGGDVSEWQPLEVVAPDYSDWDSSDPYIENHQYPVAEPRAEAQQRKEVRSRPAQPTQIKPSQPDVQSKSPQVRAARPVFAQSKNTETSRRKQAKQIVTTTTERATARSRANAGSETSKSATESDGTLPKEQMNNQRQYTRRYSASS